MWNGRQSGTPLGSVKAVTAGGGAAGTSATVWEEAWLGDVTEAGLVAGTRTADGKETGSGAGTELEAEAEAGFWEFSCSKTEADTGTTVGRWAVMSRGWFGLEAVSLSKGLQITVSIRRGDSLEAETKTGAATGTEAVKDRGAGSFPEVTVDTGTAIAFSIRLCTLEGSMTCWLSSGGGVGPVSLL